MMTNSRAAPRGAVLKGDDICQDDQAVDGAAAAGPADGPAATGQADGPAADVDVAVRAPAASALIIAWVALRRWNGLRR